MANLEKASWIAGIAGAVLAAVGLVWTVWPHSNDPIGAKPDSPRNQMEASRNGQVANVVGSNNTTIQGSGNVVNIAGGPSVGDDTFVITQKIADLPPEGMEEAFASGIDSAPTYCGDGSFTFRNMSQKPIVLTACFTGTDDCATMAGLAPGERRKFSAKDLNEGSLGFFDDEKRFVVNLAVKKQCEKE